MKVSIGNGTPSMTVNRQRKRRQKFSPNKETRREPENPRVLVGRTTFKRHLNYLSLYRFQPSILFFLILSF